MSLSAPLTRCAAIFKELSMLLKVSSHRPAERYRELPNVDVTVSSQYSPDLAEALMRDKLDVAFLRPETHACQEVLSYDNSCVDKQPKCSLKEAGFAANACSMRHRGRRQA